MKKSVNKLLLCGLVTAITISSSFTALAGTWKQDHIGWWWQENNGSYPVSTWQWIDSNNDGIAECYYFNESGYCLINTITPDGYTVNADGAWIVNGTIQTKSVSYLPSNTSEFQKQNKNNQFQFNTQVTKFMNANSYEELISGLQNVRKEGAGASSSWDGQAYWNQYYRIAADNVPFNVEWTYRKKVDKTQGGIHFIPGEQEVSYGLHEIEGTLSQIFEGMPKSSYSIDEFENMLKTLGATNIDSNTSEYNGYFYGAYFHSVNTSTAFQLGNYKCYVNTVDVQDDETVYIPTLTRIRIEKME